MISPTTTWTWLKFWKYDNVCHDPSSCVLHQLPIMSKCSLKQECLITSQLQISSQSVAVSTAGRRSGHEEEGGRKWEINVWDCAREQKAYRASDESTQGSRGSEILSDKLRKGNYSYKSLTLIMNLNAQLEFPFSFDISMCLFSSISSSFSFYNICG